MVSLRVKCDLSEGRSGVFEGVSGVKECRGGVLEGFCVLDEITLA